MADADEQATTDAQETVTERKVRVRSVVVVVVVLVYEVILVHEMCAPKVFFQVILGVHACMHVFPLTYGSCSRVYSSYTCSRATSIT